VTIRFHDTTEKSVATVRLRVSGIKDPMEVQRREEMAYSKIPEKEAVLLVRALGLLICQAGVYGPAHKVTQSAAQSVFAEMDQTLRKWGPLR
jgi:hypothetical protein